MNKQFPTYKAFWPQYVSEHQSKLNRNVHFLGTALGLLAVVLAVTNSNPWLFLLAPVFGYGLAWVGHHFIEKNHPATFTYPLWSFVADLHMFTLMCLGRMDREVKRMHVLNAEA
jgi:hypothetical protein